MPSRIWSEPPAEPPATGTLVESALRAEAKSLAVLNGDDAGTTSARNSPVRRAIGVACDSRSALLLAMIEPTITMPATISALPCPFHWLRNCGSPTVPPAPPTLVICTPLTAWVTRRTCSMVRAVWSQPPPGAAGTNIFSRSMVWACAAAMDKSGKAAAAGTAAAPPRRSRRVSMAFPFRWSTFRFGGTECAPVFTFVALSDGKPVPTFPENAPLFSVAKLARGRTSVRPDQVPGNWSFVAFAGLHLLERMGQDADRARQREQAPAERRGKAELGIDHPGGAVDIHGDGVPLGRRQLRLDGAADGGEASAHDAALGGGVHELEQARRARIAGMKAMPVAGDVAHALLGL